MLQTEGYFQFYDKFERNQLVKATDISQFQYPLANNTINGFNSYQDNGNEFIILRAGGQNSADSSGVADTQFKIENVNKFIDSKLKIGTYWYCRHLNINVQETTYPDKITNANIIAESTLEANNYADILESVFGTGNCGDLIPCLDFEDRRWNGNGELDGQGVYIGNATNSNTITSMTDTWYSTGRHELAVGCKINIKNSNGTMYQANRTITAINSNTSITIDGAPITITQSTHFIQRVAYANDIWTQSQIFLYMKTFKDVMCSRFPQLSSANGGKGIMLYTAYYYIDEASATNDIKNEDGVGIVSEIPCLWFACGAADIGSINAGYSAGTIATCTTTNYSTTIQTLESNNSIKTGMNVVIIDKDENIIGNGTVTAKPSNSSFTYNGNPVTTDSTENYKVKDTLNYPSYDYKTFGGYTKWMIWQYSTDRNRLGKQYSTSTITIDLNVFDNNNFGMNEILCYPHTKPKLVEILEDKADKTHSHIGQYLPTNSGTLDGETTITSPIAFIFKQEQQYSFKMSRNNTDYHDTARANKMFLTPSTDRWSPGGGETGFKWDVTKSVGVGADGFIYHNQVATEGYRVGTLPATAGWYRIAQCPMVLDGNGVPIQSGNAVLTSIGTFTFRNNTGGDRSNGSFIAATTFASTLSTNLTQLAYGKYTSNGITQARLVFYDLAYCYLELYHNAALQTTLEIELSDNYNWTWTPFATNNIFANGSSGVSEKVLTFSPGLVSSADVETYGQLKSTIATGTAPLVVASTTKVNNLNSSLLNGLADTDFVKKDGTVSMTGPLTLSADPTTALQASTKQYVDAIASGFKTKDSCRVATTGHIALSGTQTIDGVSLVAGNRVLVWQQLDAAQNGIYVVAVGAWTRATDFDSSSEIVAGAYSFVTDGNTYENNGFTVTTTGTITPGTTPFNFTISTGAGTINAGTGLSKVANTIAIANTAVTPGTYQSVTVNAQGQVTAGTNPTTLAGYGITDAADVNHNHTSINGSAATLTTPRSITITGDASGTTSFDGSSDVSIAVTMTGGNVYANVKAFGAVGNGITNDSVAIQSALNSLSVSGGTIIFPQGTYAIGTPLEVCSNTKITGIGNVILKRITTDNNIMHNKSDGNTGGYNANVNITIENVKFDANNTVSGVYNCTSLAFGHATNINVTNCEFYNNDGWHCLELNGVKDAIVDNCFFHDYGDPTDSTTKSHASEMLQIDLMANSNVFPWFGPYDNTACDNITIQNCRFIGNAGTDLSNSTYYSAIGNHTYVTNYQPKNIVITHNTFENVPSVITLNDVITLSICYNMCSNVYMGIVFEPHNNPTSNVVITGNKFSGLYSQTSATYNDVRFVSLNPGTDNTIGSNKFVVSNNIITNCHHHGIAGTINNIIVEGNIIDTCGRTGVYAYGGIGWNVSNNRIINCNKHAGNYQEIIVGGNASVAITNSIVSNNNATNIRCGSNQSSTFVTGNVCTSLLNPENSVCKANIINGTYTA